MVPDLLSLAAISIALGFLVLLTAWLPLVVRRLPLSLPIVAVALGVATSYIRGTERYVSSLFRDAVLEHMTEFVILIALMGVGLRIERPFSWTRWNVTFRLLIIAMPLTIGAMTVLCMLLPGLPMASALLVAAALAPTDPVLAADVQVGPTGEEEGGEEILCLANAQLLDFPIIGFTFGATIPALVVVGAIAAFLAIRLVVFFVVADQIAQAKAIVRGDEIDAGMGAAAAVIVQIGAAAEAVLDLPVEARRTLTRRQAELVRSVRRLVETFGGERGRTKIELFAPETVERSVGEGLGLIVSEEEGKRLLGDFAVARKIEDWAGTVAGASELSRDYGIPRSTLHRWQHANEVIGLLKGTKKHVFPVEQFIDGRPAPGISAVVGLAGNHRTAWLWLRQVNPVLGGRRPIDLLKQDRIEEVIETAQAYFDPQ